MAGTSVKALQLGPDADVLSQDPGEHPARGRTLEAREVAARIRTTARLVSPGHENAVAGGEAEQLALRRAPAAARAAPQWVGYEGSSSDCSTGIPAGTSSGSATSASGATGASVESTSGGASASASTSTSSASSVSAGAPAT